MTHEKKADPNDRVFHPTNFNQILTWARARGYNESL
jgi:hypothetical protein